MNHPSKNHSGSALIVTMALMGILSFMMILLLEKIIPTSQAIRGIENSTVGLYHSTSAIEKAFSSMNYKRPGLATAAGSLPIGNTQEEGKYSILQSGLIVPIPGKGTSEYDSNWNRINAGNPVQLRIFQDIIDNGSLNGMTFDIRMPKLGSFDTKAGETASTQYFTGSTKFSIVNMTLSNGTKSITSDTGTGCSTP